MSKTAFYRYAEKHEIGVTYEAGGIARGMGAPEIIPFRITLDAPTGFLFAGSDTNSDCSIQGDSGTTKTIWSRALAELESIVKVGFVPDDYEEAASHA